MTRGTVALLEVDIFNVLYKTLCLCKFMTYEKPHMTYWQVLPRSWAQAVDHHACYYFYMFYHPVLKPPRDTNLKPL